MVAARSLLPITQPELTIVIPTRNERAVIQRCIRRLETCVLNLDAEVIFVDDSDDGTERIIEAIDSKLDLRVLHRDSASREGGLATAVLDGIAAGSGRYVCVLDADLQHPPEKIADLIAATRRGADVVVASRYIAGGSAGGLSSRLRTTVSRASTSLARLLFPGRLARVSDPLSGFFLIRRDVVRNAGLRPVGFKILLEILVRGRWSHLVEVPYQFDRRGAGSSKASPAQGILYLKHLSRLMRDKLNGQLWSPIDDELRGQPL